MVDIKLANIKKTKEILEGDDTHPDILQALGLEILDNYEKLLHQSRRLVAHVGSLVHATKENNNVMNYRMKELMEHMVKTNDLVEE